MPKFTEMENLKYNNLKEMQESTNPKWDFMELLELLQDYIGNNFYGEKIERPEQAEKVINTIEELKNKFADYEAEADGKDVELSDYRVQMNQVIDVLENFVKEGM